MYTTEIKGRVLSLYTGSEFAAVIGLHPPLYPGPGVKIRFLGYVGERARKEIQCGDLITVTAHMESEIEWHDGMSPSRGCAVSFESTTPRIDYNNITGIISRVAFCEDEKKAEVDIARMDIPRYMEPQDVTLLAYAGSKAYNWLALYIENMDALYEVKATVSEYPRIDTIRVA